MVSIEKTLLRAVLAFRLIAFVWMSILATVTLVTDDGANHTLVWAALAAGLTMTAVALSRGTGNPGFVSSRLFLSVDGIVALGVALAPWLADSDSVFFGGYPVSWLMFLVFSVRLRFAMVGVALLIASQFLGAGLAPIFDVMALVRSVLSNIVVVGIMGLSFRWLRAIDARRQAAEQALAQEQAKRIRSEERANLAGKLHDSAIQTLVVLQSNADQPEEVRRLARRQERELRDLMAEMKPGEPIGLADSLRAVANDVEDLHDIRIERVLVGDLVNQGIVEAVSIATKEALINAAKHSGESRAHLFAEVTDDEVTVLVKDRGFGFVESEQDGFGLRVSVRERVGSVDGFVEIWSEGGKGTAVEMKVPRG